MTSVLVETLLDSLKIQNLRDSCTFHLHVTKLQRIRFIIFLGVIYELSTFALIQGFSVKNYLHYSFLI